MCGKWGSRPQAVRERCCRSSPGTLGEQARPGIGLFPWQHLGWGKRAEGPECRAVGVNLVWTPFALPPSDRQLCPPSLGFVFPFERGEEERTWVSASPFRACLPSRRSRRPARSHISCSSASPWVLSLPCSWPDASRFIGRPCCVGPRRLAFPGLQDLWISVAVGLTLGRH